MARAARSGSARTLAVTLLAIAGAALALVDWHLYTTPVDISPLTPEQRASESKEAKELELATPLDDKPMITFDESLQRPLFHADRKPIEHETAVAEAPAPVAVNTDMQLVGIVRPETGPGRALIRFAGEAMGKWIPEGETVNGWRLAEVKPASVVVEGEGQTLELKLTAAARPPGSEEAGESGNGDGNPQPPKRTR